MLVNTSDSGEMPRLSHLILGDGTPRKAFLTALVVGTLLTMINHGDLILSGDFPPLAKVALTYCVPFCVTTWGAVTGKRALLRKQNMMQATNGIGSGAS